MRADDARGGARRGLIRLLYLQAKKAPTPKSDPLAAAVDELGSIEKELAPLAGRIARAEQLRKAIRQQTPDATSEIAGERFVAVLGPRGNQTVIRFPALVKKIGAAAYAKVATVTLKALEEHWPEHAAAVTSQEQTGTRSLKVLERGA